MTGQGEAREQIAEELFHCHLSGKPYKPRPSGPPAVDYDEFADAVLATPAVAEAFAAVERVRALVDGYDVMGRVLHHVLVAETFAGVATDLRRALDGET